MSATMLSLLLLAIAGAVLTLGAVPRKLRPLPVRVPTRVARRVRAR